MDEFKKVNYSETFFPFVNLEDIWNFKNSLEGTYPPHKKHQLFRNETFLEKQCFGVIEILDIPWTDKIKIFHFGLIFSPQRLP